MKPGSFPYGTKSDAELQRTRAQLGPRGQENVPPAQAPETLEHAYQRGYRDGWRDAGSRNFWRGWFWGSWM